MTRREILAAGAMAAANTLIPGRAPAANREWTPEGFHSARVLVGTPFGRIACVERGRGPAALFLHGWPLNGYQWRGAMARLADVRRCIAPDFMGLGYSQIPAEADLAPLQQMNMLVALMDELEVHQADILSNDSATAVAQLLAAYHPQRVRTLLITNGDVHTNSPPPPLGPVLQEARAGKLVDRFDLWLADNSAVRSDAGLGGVYTDPRTLTPELVDVYLRPLVTGAKRRAQGQLYGVAMIPNPLPAIEARLRTLRIPARLLWGTADLMFPLEWAGWLDRTLPQSRGLRLIKGAKLFFPEEFPEIIEVEARKLWAA